MFLLQRNETATANLWLKEPGHSLYHSPLWPASYVDVTNLTATTLPDQ